LGVLAGFVVAVLRREGKLLKGFQARAVKLPGAMTDPALQRLVLRVKL